MALPTNVGFGTVVGRLIDSTGQPLQGTVEFVPSPKRLLNATATPSPVIILPRPIVAPLTEGAFSASLVATDDPDNNPRGWTYNVRFKLEGASLDSFDIEVPEGQEVDVAIVAPVDPQMGVTMTRSVGLGDDVEGATFWGVFTEGNEPTPPDDGKIHYGFRVTA